MSIKAYKYRLYANKRTIEKLQWVLDRCREVYNAGLQERRDAYVRRLSVHLIASKEQKVESWTAPL